MTAIRLLCPCEESSSASSAADGKLGAWTPQDALLEGRTSFELAVSGDYLYLIGGGNGGGGLDTVFSAQVRYPLP